jgi:hypothetical protein
MITFPRSKLLLPMVTVVAAAALALPAQGLAQACGVSDPNDLSDAHLPAGYKSVRWGMSGDEVQALRGYPLERVTDVNPDVYQLREEIPEANAPTVTLMYVFYRDRLMEVTQYLRPDFIELAESSLLTPYTEKYGPFTDVETLKGAPTTSQPINRVILEKRWTWCDRFTEVVLARQLQHSEVVMRRSSRLLFAELRQDTDHQRDVDTWTRLRELPTD